MSVVQGIAALRGRRRKRSLQAEAVKSGFLEERAPGLPSKDSSVSEFAKCCLCAGAELRAGWGVGVGGPLAKCGDHMDRDCSEDKGSHKERDYLALGREGALAQGTMGFMPEGP